MLDKEFFLSTLKIKEIMVGNINQPLLPRIPSAPSKHAPIDIYVHVTYSN